MRISLIFPPKITTARNVNVRALSICKQVNLHNICHEHNGHLSVEGVLGNLGIPTYVGIHYQISLS